ncbi:MAG: hypothetical protein S4CHLAM81_03790 [Chlamydiales bacterium]|nr:hypothetical protein [Chlamydiales bacterium]MCH9635168.1 hypothetical protein [Chlamydiales bacterium]MCH9703399.1 hypothetical protein [Chlamydiota bacterium]
MSERSRLFDSVIVASWWVILYLLALLFLYDQATGRRCKESARLFEKKSALVIQERELRDELKELDLRLASQGDPLWIELLLREKLGLVGEDETKVLFQ